MPNYEYKCPDCNVIETYNHRSNEPCRPLCIKCSVKGVYMKKVITGGSAVHFKGSGFYETDYKGK